MDYKPIIESAYNRKNWQVLLRDIFGNRATFFATPTNIDVNSNMAKTALYLGKIDLADGKNIAVYEVPLAESVVIERNKVSIRNLLVSHWRNSGFAGAFMFCFKENESVLRFSYVSEIMAFQADGTLGTEATDTKRYTYVLGEGRGCRTAIEQFSKLKESAQNLSDVTEAFSVEALTKQFYKDLFEWYQWAVDDSANISFPNNTTIETDDREDIEKKLIRMITRIMFVWFIKQKNLVPHKIFDIDYLKTILKEFDPYSQTVGNFYNAILQNLFFATLNRAIEEEDGSKRKFATSTKRDIKTLYRYDEMFKISKEQVIDLFAEVPFLNGGLFECLDKTRYIDGVEVAYNLDGFSRNDRTFADGRFKHRAVVPNNLFFEPEKGLVSILNRYNFTIEENTPEEQQVALDPELLGKVFENLLGAYNPETKETARNQSGSFYTPREIVNYMVDESLVAYLGDTPFVRSLFSSDFIYDSAQKVEYKKVADKLKSVKVLDPACGSGAFPMGLLNRMMGILERISPEESVYDLKLAIIENCLYGSDIQSIAAQITKLRFFISLICNCEKDASKPNFGIPTLPNLETKFVTANSLIAKKKRAAQTNLFENPEIEPTKEELARIRHEHFSAKSASTKRRLREKDQVLREKLAQLLSDDDNFAPEDAKQMAEWNPYDQNAVSPFFDPEWMFGVKDGFDIVIGNPPYIQLQNDGGKLGKMYQPCGYKTFASTGDIYCLFYERGHQLLKQGGHLCYITSNKWMRAGYGEKTREFFATQTNPMLLIDFAGVKIFESATVDTNILLFAKDTNKHQTVCAVTNKQNKDSVNNLSDFVRQQNNTCDFKTSESWVILTPIEQSIKRKIEAVGTPLKDWDIQINYGIKTGYNEAFIITTDKRNEILDNCLTADERKRTEVLIRPILRGRDIKRYGYEWAGLYLIATFPSKHYDIELYPAVKQHLLSYGMERLEQTGKKYIINGQTVTARKKTNNKWFETQDSISYWDDFNHPKIVWGNLNLNGSYSIAPEGMFVNAPSPFIATSNLAILHILNSKIADYYIRSLGVTRNGGYFEYKPMFVEKFPIPLNGLSDISSYPSNPTKQQEQEIDKLICRLYCLTAEEISFIHRQ
jgi:type I restriction-modification system DNA methylase subunit